MKKVLLPSILLYSIAFASNSFAGANYTELRVYPENVGMFTELGTQQFVAFGLNSQTNAWDNITTEVTWQSSSEDHITFDENGVATIKSGVTSGIVRVNAIYPKVGSTPDQDIDLNPIYFLLDEDEQQAAPQAQ